MAGLPASCVSRARSVLAALEQRQKGAVSESSDAPPAQMDLFMAHPILKELEAVDPNQLTPLAALQLLHHFVQELKSPQRG
jgi:DNA mismatch repair protein MutS